MRRAAFRTRFVEPPEGSTGGRRVKRRMRQRGLQNGCLHLTCCICVVNQLLIWLIFIFQSVVQKPICLNYGNYGLKCIFWLLLLIQKECFSPPMKCKRFSKATTATLLQYCIILLYQWGRRVSALRASDHQQSASVGGQNKGNVRRRTNRTSIHPGKRSRLKWRSRGLKDLAKQVKTGQAENEI